MVRVPDASRGAGLENDHGQAMADHVMEFMRHPDTLFQNHLLSRGLALLYQALIRLSEVLCQPRAVAHHQPSYPSTKHERAKYSGRFDRLREARETQPDRHEPRGSTDAQTQQSVPTIGEGGHREGQD